MPHVFDLILFSIPSSLIRTEGEGALSVLIRLDGMLTKIKSNTYALHKLEPPTGFQRVKVNFNYLPGRRWDSEQFQKRGENMGQGQVFLKGGGWHFSYLIFSRFIFFKFRNYFILCKIALYVV